MVRAKTFQHLWHAKQGQKNDPILSTDVHPTFSIFATAGADNEIKIWRLVEGAADTRVDFLCTLQAHTKTVNAVRFSPNGECLASVSDDAVVAIWRPLAGVTWDQVLSEKQIQRSYMRRHTDDIYDVAWSPCSRYVVTGSVDNTAIVWDVPKGRDVAVLTGHTQFVQGVAWDPSGVFIVTQSNDRTARVWRRAAPERRKSSGRATTASDAKIEFKCVQVIKSRTAAAADSARATDGAVMGASVGAGAGVGSGAGVASAGVVKHHIFLDESVPSFFRRPAWSPDGTLLLTPTGSMRDGVGGGGSAWSTTLLFTRSNFSEPIAHYPGTAAARPSVAVRVCPRLWAARPVAGAADDAVQQPPSNGAFSLPYRMLVAVATLDAVIVYDTSLPFPVAALANFHYDKITDIAWSPSGRTLLLTSIDGYVSALCLEDAELGEPLPLADVPTLCRREHTPTFPIRAKKVALQPVSTPAREHGQQEGPEVDDAAGGSADEWGAAAAGVDDATPAPAPPAAGGKRKIALTLLAPAGQEFVEPTKRPAVAAAPVAFVEPTAPAPAAPATTIALAAPTADAARLSFGGGSVLEALLRGEV